MVHITTKIIQFDGKRIRKSGFLWFGQESAKGHLKRLLEEVDDENKNEAKPVLVREAKQNYEHAEFRARDIGFFLDFNRCIEHFSSPAIAGGGDDQLKTTYKRLERTVAAFRKYFSCFSVKILLFIELSLGYWSKDVLKSFEVENLTRLYDGDPENANSDHFRSQKVIETIGISHSILWQYLPLGTWPAKLSEAINSPPWFVGAEGETALYAPLFNAFLVDAPGSGLSK